MRPKNIHLKSQIPVLNKADKTLIKGKSITSTTNDKHTSPINTPSNKTISTTTSTTAFQRTDTKNNNKIEKDITNENEEAVINIVIDNKQEDMDTNINSVEEQVQNATKV